MKVSYQPYKGTRDFYPEDYRLQQYIFKKWRQVLARHGYQAYEASVVEPLDLYEVKNQSNPEILQEQIYTFSDRGQRKVVLRPEMTPTLARMVAARRQFLHYPLRWYSIPNLWRYERPQKGRLREHWQLNVDLFDVLSPAAELELILIIENIFSAFGASPGMYDIHLNSRKLVHDICQQWFQLNSAQEQKLILLLDRYNKVNPRSFKLSCQQIVGDQKETFRPFWSKLQKLLRAEKLSDLPAELHNLNSYQEVETLLLDLRQVLITNVFWDYRIVRGFEYYTGLVFEVFDRASANRRSLVGGGRYDNLLQSFGTKPLSGVGFGMGDVTLADFLETHHLLPAFKNPVKLYIILLEGVAYVQIVFLLKMLYKEKIAAVVDNRPLKASKRLEVALKRKIEYVLFVGPDDFKRESFNLKHLPTSSEQRLNATRLVTKLAAE